MNKEQFGVINLTTTKDNVTFEASKFFLDNELYENMRCSCDLPKFPEGCGCGICENCGGLTFCENNRLYNKEILILQKKEQL